MLFYPITLQHNYKGALLYHKFITFNFLNIDFLEDIIRFPFF